MTDEPENLVLQMLREMRAESAGLREEVAAFRKETADGLRELGLRVTLLEVRAGAMQTAIDKLSEGQREANERLGRIERHTGLVKV